MTHTTHKEREVLELLRTHEADAFMAFWTTLREFARSYELPEPRFGEAREWYAEFRNQEGLD